jgi:hypothetical protein
LEKRRKKGPPEIPVPQFKQDTNDDDTHVIEQYDTYHNNLYVAVDSANAWGTTHRRSATGIILRIVGETVFF